MSTPSQAPAITVTEQIRRLLRKPPSSILRATAPELCEAMPLLVRFFHEHDDLGRRVEALEAGSAPHRPGPI